jgi:hypothetical protein
MWKHWVEAHAVLTVWIATAGTLGSVTVGRVLRAVLELVAIRARDRNTRLAALEAIQLRRRDAASLSSYISDASEQERSGDTRSRARRRIRRGVR